MLLRELFVNELWLDDIKSAFNKLTKSAPDAIATPSSPPVSKGTVTKLVKVEKGDTVYSISKAHGNTTPEEIAKLNGLDSNFTIKVGQELKVPVGGSSTQVQPDAKPQDVKPQTPYEQFVANVKAYYGKPLTADDIQLLIKIGAGESDHLTDDSMEMAAIIATVLNRSSKYGKSIPEIIYAPGQFHAADGKNARFENPSKALVDEVITGVNAHLTSIPKNILYFGSRYHTAYGSRKARVWKYQLLSEPHKVYGGTIFSASFADRSEGWKLLKKAEQQAAERRKAKKLKKATTGAA